MKRRKSTSEAPEWSADVGRGMKLEVSAILNEFKDRPLTYVVSLRTGSGTFYAVGELIESGQGMLSRPNIATFEAKGADVVEVWKAWIEMVEWATVKTAMDV